DHDAPFSSHACCREAIDVPLPVAVGFRVVRRWCPSKPERSRSTAKLSKNCSRPSSPIPPPGSGLSRRTCDKRARREEQIAHLASGLRGRVARAPRAASIPEWAAPRRGQLLQIQLVRANHRNHVKSQNKKYFALQEFGFAVLVTP